MALNVTPTPNCWRKCIGEGTYGWYRGYVSPDSLDALVVKGKCRLLTDPPPKAEQRVDGDESTPSTTPSSDAAEPEPDAAEPEPDAAEPVQKQSERRPRSVR